MVDTFCNGDMRLALYQHGSVMIKHLSIYQFTIHPCSFQFTFLLMSLLWWYWFLFLHFLVWTKKHSQLHGLLPLCKTKKQLPFHAVMFFKTIIYYFLEFIQIMSIIFSRCSSMGNVFIDIYQKPHYVSINHLSCAGILFSYCEYVIYCVCETESCMA